MRNVTCFVAAALTAICANAFEYNVTKSAICPRWQGAVAGEWTMDREAALAQAKSEGAYTLVLFTGAWWCPFCETFEAKVLTSQAWADYVAKSGYYLVECDYPYRYAVPEGQENKSLHPELGNGWGFKCWLYDADYLAANGLTAEEGLAAIQKMYDYQDAMALPGSTTDTVNRYGGGTMDLHRIPYATLVMIRPDGTEAGRVKFQWTNPSAISDKDALNYIIDNLEMVKSGRKSALFANPEAGGLTGEAAQTYDAVLTDAGGVPMGVATVKTAKKVRDKPINVSANVQPSDGRKVALKAATSAREGELVSLTKKGSASVANVIIGANGITGLYTDGAASYNVLGARNVFKAKDADAKARAATLAKGTWTIALATANNGGNTFANGYSTLSATVGNGGKVKVKGTLGDGSKASISAQAIMGENGKVLVPVIEKKGAYSFMLEFANGMLARVTGLSAWKSTNRTAPFTATWSPNVAFAAASGSGTVPTTMYLQIAGFDSAAGIGGKALTVSPADDMVVVAGNKWTGTKGVSDLNATFKPADGTFKGSFNFYVLDNGRPKKVRATISGVVVDGVPYGTAVIKGVGSWAIKFVGSCGGGC